MKCKKLNFIIISLILVITFVYVFRVDGAKGLWEALTAASPVWLGAAVGLMGIYWRSPNPPFIREAVPSLPAFPQFFTDSHDWAVI